jgi:hypothetical protein
MAMRKSRHIALFAAGIFAGLGWYTFYSSRVVVGIVLFVARIAFALDVGRLARDRFRHCVGLELEPKYCDVVVHRWEDFTGRKAHATVV